MVMVTLLLMAVVVIMVTLVADDYGGGGTFKTQATTFKRQSLEAETIPQHSLAPVSWKLVMYAPLRASCSRGCLGL